VIEGTIAADGSSVTAARHLHVWLVGDTGMNDTVKIQVGDLIFFKNPNGNALQTVTSLDTHAHLFRREPQRGGPVPFSTSATSCSSGTS